MTMNKLLILM